MSTTRIIIPDRPDIEGLYFRSIRGEEDADALYAIHVGCVTHDKIDLLSKIEYLPGLDRLRDGLLESVLKFRFRR
jgi:hypothetical protein